jgi:predicted anti-sigma-YlaC factor YlaD
MNNMGCEKARDSIPLLAAGAVDEPELSQVEAHVAVCEACRAEASLAAALFRTRPMPPADLAGRIKSSVRDQSRAVQRPWWGLSAAAVAVLALGIGVMSDTESVPGAVPVYAAESGSTDLWLSDDGLVAGAPTLDDLTDEALEQLLNDLGTGGAA